MECPEGNATRMDEIELEDMVFISVAETTVRSSLAYLSANLTLTRNLQTKYRMLATGSAV